MENYNNLLKLLAEFDDSEERAEIAALESEQKHDREAIKSADAIITETRAELIKRRAETKVIDEKDTSELVARLRTGDLKEKPVEAEDVLERRIAAHVAGKNKLLNDIDAREGELLSVKGRLRNRLNDLAEMEAESLLVKVEDTLNQLSRCHADTTALHACLPSQNIRGAHDRLKDIMGEIVDDWPVFRSRTVDVDPELVKALKSGKAAFDFLGLQIPDKVKLPDHNAKSIAGMTPEFYQAAVSLPNILGNQSINSQQSLSAPRAGKRFSALFGR